MDVYGSIHNNHYTCPIEAVPEPIAHRPDEGIMTDRDSYSLNTKDRRRLTSTAADSIDR